MGKTLADDVIDLVVEKLLFENMKKDSQLVSESKLDKQQFAPFGLIPRFVAHYSSVNRTTQPYQPHPHPHTHPLLPLSTYIPQDPWTITDVLCVFSA